MFNKFIYSNNGYSIPKIDTIIHHIIKKLTSQKEDLLDINRQTSVFIKPPCAVG